MNSPAASKEVEDKIVSAFLREPGAGLVHREMSIGNHVYHEFSASFKLRDGAWSFGHGQSQIKHEALLKAVCENLERRAMLNYFHAHPVEEFSPDDSFHYHKLRTSNGWAIHTDRAKAEHAAFAEAIERHILILSFLKDGWGAFYKINETEIDGTKYISVVSRYVVNGSTAGLVIAKPQDCPGISLGHFSDKIENLSTSSKWMHALYEAKGALDGYKNETSKAGDGLIRKEVIHYLQTPWIEPDFLKTLEQIELQKVAPVIQHENFKDCDGNELFIANARNGGLVPLFFFGDLDVDSRHYLSVVLSRDGIALPNIDRIPVL